MFAKADKIIVRGFCETINGAGLVIILVIFILTTSPETMGQHQEHQHGDVNFSISCNQEAQREFTRGLVKLHHMMYEQAEAEFMAASESDPDCAMAHWGIAMSVIHPLWGERPSEDALKKGQAALEKAKLLNAPTQRIQEYIAAVEVFFKNWETTAYPAQLAAWEAAQKKVYQAYPDDIDAGAFYALAHLAIAPKDDKSFANQKEAGALLENLHAKAPQHPGLFHYIIHSYDNPVLAGRGLDVARGYDKLAPDVPHALHMPSHIFVRLGFWPDVIDLNARSAAAALRQPVGNATSVHYAHALDYMEYGYLQLGQDNKARVVVDQINAVDNFQPSFATAYGVAAVQARYPLERAQWADAAAIPIRANASIPWDKYPGAESILYFARGLGSARSGDAPGAKKAIENLDRLHGQLVSTGENYWAVYTDSQRKTVAAWLALSDGEKDQALKLMREAADLEDSVDKHPVTPGAVLPARELLGDMLLLLEKPEEAVEAYEVSLKISPSRFNSLYGAGRASELAGDTDTATVYYTRLIEMTAQADSERPGLEHAKEFLSKKIK